MFYVLVAFLNSTSSRFSTFIYLVTQADRHWVVRPQTVWEAIKRKKIKTRT